METATPKIQMRDKVRQSRKKQNVNTLQIEPVLGQENKSIALS
jgi:hypothetical protein